MFHNLYCMHVLYIVKKRDLLELIKNQTQLPFNFENSMIDGLVVNFILMYNSADFLC